MPDWSLVSGSGSFVGWVSEAHPLHSDNHDPAATSCANQPKLSGRASGKFRVERHNCSRARPLRWHRNRRGVPDAGRPVDAARGEAVAVGAEGQADDASVVAAEGEQLLARRRVPEFDRPVEAGRGDPSPVGAEGNLIDARGVAAEGEECPAGRRVPDLELIRRRDATGEGEAASIGAYCQPPEDTDASPQGGQLAACRSRPRASAPRRAGRRRGTGPRGRWSRRGGRHDDCRPGQRPFRCGPRGYVSPCGSSGPRAGSFHPVP